MEDLRVSATIMRENELGSGLSVRPTKPDCLLPGHEYEGVRGLRAFHGPFGPAYVV
jgi:hypothetical protein